MGRLDPKTGEALEVSLRTLSASIILPRYRHLREDEIEEKSPGDLVTVVDRESEAYLVRVLEKLSPGIPVLGEESAHASPGRLVGIEKEPWLWVVDPLDGTANFTHGRRHFAVMVALLHFGETVQAWIHDPLEGWMVEAKRGEGARLDGRRLLIPKAPDWSALRGAVYTHYLPPSLRAEVETAGRSFRGLENFGCAGHEYVAIARGEKHFVSYYRMLPWDHAPGTLVVQEAGAYVARLDESSYIAGKAETGLLVAPERGTLAGIASAALAGSRALNSQSAVSVGRRLRRRCKKVRPNGWSNRESLAQSTDSRANPPIARVCPWPPRFLHRHRPLGLRLGEPRPRWKSWGGIGCRRLVLISR